MTDSKQEIIQLNSVEAYNRLYGLETYHPLVGVVNIPQMRSIERHVTFNYGLYALFLKHGANCTLRYGREVYDYQAGTIVTFSPGQVVSIDNEPDTLLPAVSGLVFHPDILFGTPMAGKMRQYSFFDYDERESLHLSERAKCHHRFVQQHLLGDRASRRPALADTYHRPHRTHPRLLHALL